MTDEEKILQIISDSLGVNLEDIHPESDLRADLNAQDLEIADLLMKLEKEFKVNLTSEESKSVKTVSEIIEAFINR